MLQDDGVSAMDTVSKLLAAHQANPAKVTKEDVIHGGLTNIGAGTDTTSISLSAVVYYLWRNPRYLQRLREELKGVPDANTYEQAKGIPYLEAVIKEALRVHPAAGLPIQRVVPQGGRTIAGRFFPAGVSIPSNRKMGTTEQGTDNRWYKCLGSSFQPPGFRRRCRHL